MWQPPCPCGPVPSGSFLVEGPNPHFAERPPGPLGTHFTSRRRTHPCLALSCPRSLSACCRPSPPPAAQGKPASGSATAAATAPSVVNLNSATVAQIATLPGIGEKAAQRIVEYREKNGGFKKIEELMNVKGIGEKSFLKLKPLVTVGDRNAAAK